MTRSQRYAQLLFDRIRQAVPDAQLQSADYDFSFSAFSNQSRRAIWLVRAPRPETGQTQYRLAKRDLPEAIRALSAP